MRSGNESVGSRDQESDWSGLNGSAARLVRGQIGGKTFRHRSGPDLSGPNVCSDVILGGVARCYKHPVSSTVCWAPPAFTSFVYAPLRFLPDGRSEETPPPLALNRTPRLFTVQDSAAGSDLAVHPSWSVHSWLPSASTCQV